MSDATVMLQMRLDAALVMHRLAGSREAACDLTREGKVLVNGSVALKPARQVRKGDRIEVTMPPRFVSRGGLKLEASLQRFSIDVSGLRVLDVGSSTGGFTDCLLQNGARAVCAVDVGTNQLHEKVRFDARVKSFEQTNIKDFIDPERSGFDLVVVDVSFTSIRHLTKHLLNLTRSDGQLVILVKPQFEVGHRDASKGKGVIRDPALWRTAILTTAHEFAQYNVSVIDVALSKIRGAQGNAEFFLYISKLPIRQISNSLEKAIEREILQAQGVSNDDQFET